MNLFKISFKLILQIFFVTIFFSTLNARNVDKFENGENVANYFTGILLLNEGKYNKSYKFLKKLDGLENKHSNYSSRYLFSLVNLGKFDEAYNYSRKLEKRKSANFESDLIIGVYYLKNEKHELAHRYFSKLKDRKSKFLLNDFVSTSLLNWNSFKNLDLNSSQKKIDDINSKFENLKTIQNVFLHCFYRSKKTEFLFENLVAGKNSNFSRYNYFYALYLSSIGKIKHEKKILKKAVEQYPRNLILNQYKLDLKNNKTVRDFNCQNLSHVVAEILYITANALSSQQFFSLSNFYLNISKFLNDNFHSFDTLLAENFYNTDNLNQAKKIYSTISNKGSAYNWYAAQQKANILIQEKKNKEAINILKRAYEKLPRRNIYEKYDYAKFLKNNERFKDSIKLYSEIIEIIDSQHPLYPKATDGRGVAYERTGEWDKAEKDLLSSLKANPDQAYVINYLAYSWIEQGVKIKKSLEMLKKANELRSNDPYIIDSLGWALFKLKKYNDSKKYLQSAVKLLPADPTVNDHFGDVLWMSGNKIQARYFWKYVLNLEEAEKDLKENIKTKLISGL